MADVNHLSVRVGASVSQFMKDWQSVEDKMSSASASLASAGSTLTTAFTVPITAAGGAAVYFANEFNVAMANIGTLQIPEERVLQLKQAILDLSTETGTSATVLSAAMYEIISSFGDSEQSMNLLRIANEAARAGLTDTSTAVSAIQAVIKGYNLDVSEAGSVSDKMFQTVVDGKTSFEELAGSVGRVVPLANALGVSQEELFATFSTASGAVGSTAEVSTKLAATYAALMNPSKNLQAAFAEMGYESGAAAVAGLGFSGAISAIVGTAEKSKIPLGALVGSTEAQTLMLALAGSLSDQYDTKLTNMENSAGAAGIAFERSTTGLGGFRQMMNETKTTVENAAIKFGDALIPKLEAFKPLMEAGIGLLEGAVTWFTNLDKPMQDAILAFGATLAILGPIALAISGLLALGVSATFVIWAGAIAGVVASLVLAYQESETFRGIVNDVWDVVTGLWNEIVLFVQQVNNITDAFIQGNPQLMNFLGFIGDVIGDVVTATAKVLLWLSPLSSLKRAFEDINKVLKIFQTDTKDATTDAKANTVAVEDLGTEQKKTEAEVKTTTGTIRNQGVQLRNLKSDKEAAKKATEEFKKEQERADKVAQFYTDKIQGQSRATKDLKTDLDTVRTATLPPFIAAMNSLGAAWDSNTSKIVDNQAQLRDFRAVTVPNFIADQVKIEDAFRSLNIVSDVEFSKTVAVAKAAYQTIAAGGGTNFEVDSAYLAYLRLQVSETQRAGGQIQADTLQTISDLEGKLKGPDGTQKLQAPFASVFTSISTTVQDLSDSLYDSLFGSSSESWGERMTKAMQGLSKAVWDSLTQPFLDAITGPNGLIKKALDPLVDKLTSITTGFFGVSAPSGGGGGGGNNPAGIIGGAIGDSVAGVISAVTGVVSAIADIFGVFQQQRMIKALGQIEENTRFLKVDFIENKPTLKELIWEAHDFLYYIHDDLRTNGGVRQRLDEISHNTYWSLQSFDTYLGKLNHLSAIDTNIADMKSKLQSVIVNVNGITDPKAVAEAVMKQIEQAVAMA